MRYSFDLLKSLAQVIMNQKLRETGDLKNERGKSMEQSIQFMNNKFLPSHAAPSLYPHYL